MMFSVIVPVYNAAKYLRPCIDSVLNQTERDWECVCVDDGSKDESGKILDEYAAKDPRFKVIHQTNAGVSAARNAALNVVQGDWITWLDADDMYARDRLEVARVIIEKEHPDLVRFRTYFGPTEGTEYRPSEDKRLTYRVIVGANAKKWGWWVLAPGGMVWTWIARRELLTGVRFPVGMRIKEDSIYCAMIANRLERFVQSEYPACYYRQIEGSAMHSIRRADDCLRLLREVKKLYLSQLSLRETIGEDVFGVMVRWLRVHCESDIIDWVIQQRGERYRAGEIHALYTELKSMGVFDCASILKKHYRRPMEWWDKTGLIWPIEVVGALVNFVRRLRRIRGR